MLRTWGSVLTVSAMLLSGCAPHPGTGNWVPDEADNSGFVRIHVQYDGKMDFYRDGEDAAVMHCFWAGESETAIGLQCTLAENPDIEKHYRLRVSEHQHAELLQGGDVIGRYIRSEKR
ncbi:MAG: hypothetical protein ABW162_00250 [Candidatus Sedimenticola sp. PURPLELP]